MGYNKEPLQDVKAFDQVRLFPEVKVDPLSPGSSTIQVNLRNRGEGIGKMRVLVNGKEIMADARGPKPDPDAKEAYLKVGLAGAAMTSPGRRTPWRSSPGMTRVTSPAGGEWRSGGPPPPGKRKPRRFMP